MHPSWVCDFWYKAEFGVISVRVADSKKHWISATLFGPTTFQIFFIEVYRQAILTRCTPSLHAESNFLISSTNKGVVRFLFISNKFNLITGLANIPPQYYLLTFQRSSHYPDHSKTSEPYFSLPSLWPHCGNTSCWHPLLGASHLMI